MAILPAAGTPPSAPLAEQATAAYEKLYGPGPSGSYSEVYAYMQHHPHYAQKILHAYVKHISHPTGTHIEKNKKKPPHPSEPLFRLEDQPDNPANQRLHQGTNETASFSFSDLAFHYPASATPAYVVQDTNETAYFSYYGSPKW